jgi:uncharacterized protein YndB with AHSA1/START domain
MTETKAEASVRKTVTVAASQERAFEVFTAGIGSWWPREHHIGAAELAGCAYEPKVGGRWYEIGVDGSECDWGQVLVWEPPKRVVTTWQLQADFTYDPDPAKGSEIEVRFIPEGPNRTRVELEHRNFDRHGPSGATVRDKVSNPGGWGYVIGQFAAKIGTAGPA